MQDAQPFENAAATIRPRKSDGAFSVFPLGEE